MSIAERIVSLRKAKGWSRSEFQRRVGYSWTAVTNWESGKYEPKREVMKDIAVCLGVSPSYIESGEESIEDHPEVFAEWLKTPEGQRATDEERDWLRGYRSDRQPTVASLSLMLAARRMELPEGDLGE